MSTIPVRLGSRCAWLSLLFAACVCHAQAAPASNNTDTSSIGNTCLQRTTPLTVLRNTAGLQLQPANLQIQIGGGSAAIMSLKQEDISPRVILLLDTSGSMANSFGPKWTNALLAAGFALNAIPPQSPTALVTFSEQTQVSGFGTPQEIQQKLVALKNAKPHGRTALYDAIHKSLQLFGPPQFGDAIYVISDAGDDYGREQRKEVATELIERGIRAFAFVVLEPTGSASPRSALTPEERNGPPIFSGSLT